MSIIYGLSCLSFRVCHVCRLGPVMSLSFRACDICRLGPVISRLGPVISVV